jgi:hypothetical protein
LKLIFQKILASQKENNRQAWILAAGFAGRGVASMDAGAKPTWTYSRRPLEANPAAKSRMCDKTRMQDFLGRLI